MTKAVRAMLKSFDALSDSEPYEVAIEVLRRTMRTAPPVLPDEALLTAADHLFRKLDHQEGVDGRLLAT